VELHGGQIHLETRRDEGSTFKFTMKTGMQARPVRPLLK
jgi:light-regulated signal transduction histidine kinase (bacteriophytochrome)